LSRAQTLFELDCHNNIVTADGIIAIHSATECVTLAEGLLRSGLETREVFLNVFAVYLKLDL
jgi:hypothetical protein